MCWRIDFFFNIYFCIMNFMELVYSFTYLCSLFYDLFTYLCIYCQIIHLLIYFYFMIYLLIYVFIFSLLFIYIFVQFWVLCLLLCWAKARQYSGSLLFLAAPFINIPSLINSHTSGVSVNFSVTCTR